MLKPVNGIPRQRRRRPIWEIEVNSFLSQDCDICQVVLGGKKADSVYAMLFKAIRRMNVSDQCRVTRREGKIFLQKVQRG